MFLKTIGKILYVYYILFSEFNVSYIEGSKPKTYPKYQNNDPFNLNVRDIEGSQAGSKNKYNKYVSEDYNLRTDDINKKNKSNLSSNIIVRYK